MKSLRMQKEIRKLKKAVRKEPVQIEGYEIESHLADGHAGSIFRARRSDEDYVLKIMAPSLIPGKLMYAFFLQGKHGYLLTQKGSEVVEKAIQHQTAIGSISDFTIDAVRFGGFAQGGSKVSPAPTSDGYEPGSDPLDVLLEQGK